MSTILQIPTPVSISAHSIPQNQPIKAATIRVIQDPGIKLSRAAWLIDVGPCSVSNINAYICNRRHPTLTEDGITIYGSAANPVSASPTPFSLQHLQVSHIFSMFSPATRQIPGVISTRLSQLARPTHRQYSTPRPPPRSPAPQSKSNFPIIPIVILIAISSGSYALLVKSRTGQQTTRAN